MHWRVKELSWLAPAIEWLSPEDALRIYQRVDRLQSHQHYGFDPSAVRDIERVSSETDVTAWLQERVLRSERAIVVFGCDAVCRLPVSTLIEQWRDMFLPSRDDVIIIDESREWALFYCHEDEFEFAHTPA
jgi:hypothetical protein